MQPGEIAVVLAHPALDAAAVAGPGRPGRRSAIRRPVEDAGAMFHGLEVRGGVEHLAGVVQEDAGDGEGVAGGPGADAVGVHGFEVLEGFGRGRRAGGQERGEGEGAKVKFRSCSVHVQLCQGRRNGEQA